MIRELVARKMQELVKDPRISVRIHRIKVEQVPKYDTGGEQSTVLVRLSTNNRPLVSGAVGGLPLDGYFGLNTEYLSGYLDGYFGAKKRDLSFYLDVWNVPWDATHEYNDGLRFIERKEALSNRIIEVGSPIDRIMKQYDLTYLEIAGPVITAPDPATLEMISQLTRELDPLTFADLFCGTGSVAKAVLTNSPKCKVLCVDKFTIPIAKQTLLHFSKRTTFMDTDIFSTKIRGRFDLVFADPFDHLALDFARTVVPKIGRRCKVFVMSHGFTRDGYWCDRVRRMLRNTFGQVKPIDRGGVAFTRCW